MKKNEIIEVGQACHQGSQENFQNQNYTSFHSHYHCLIPPTKQAVKYLYLCLTPKTATRKVIPFQKSQQTNLLNLP